MIAGPNVGARITVTFDSDIRKMILTVARLLIRCRMTGVQIALDEVAHLLLICRTLKRCALLVFWIHDIVERRLLNDSSCTVWPEGRRLQFLCAEDHLDLVSGIGSDEQRIRDRAHGLMSHRSPCQRAAATEQTRRRCQDFNMRLHGQLAYADATRTSSTVTCRK